MRPNVHIRKSNSTTPAQNNPEIIHSGKKAIGGGYLCKIMAHSTQAIAFWRRAGLVSNLLDAEI
jgi:hypothetical protein